MEHHSQATTRVNFLSVCMTSSGVESSDCAFVDDKAADPPCRNGHGRDTFQLPTSRPFSRNSRHQDFKTSYKREHNFCQVAGITLQGSLGLMLSLCIESRRGHVKEGWNSRATIFYPSGSSLHDETSYCTLIKS
jgi:hypothetical protein